LCPVSASWFISGSTYKLAILFNGLIFGLTSVSAQWLLRR
jgi:hypothetical protein